MHSSTVRCSGRFLEVGGCLSEGCLPRGCLPRGCLPRGCLPRGVYLGGVCLGGVYLGGVSLGGVCLGVSAQGRLGGVSALTQWKIQDFLGVGGGGQ